MNNCQKCGANEFRRELRQVQVGLGCDNELQVSGLASLEICLACGHFHLPNRFNLAPEPFNPGRRPPQAQSPQSAAQEAERELNAAESATEPQKTPTRPRSAISATPATPAKSAKKAPRKARMANSSKKG